MGAPQQHRQPPIEPLTPDSIDLKTSANLGVTSEPAERRKGAAQKSLQHSPRSLHYSPHHLLGVGGTIYNTHTLKPFKELGLNSQRVKKLASKLHVVVTVFLRAGELEPRTSTLMPNVA